MNFTFYIADLDKKTPSDCKIVDVSDDLFWMLAKSEFSQIGNSKKVKINLDGEMIEVKAVGLTSFIRKTLLDYLKEFLVKVLKESLNKMGSSPSSMEFADHTFDLRSILELIEALENPSFTHLNRIGG